MIKVVEFEMINGEMSIFPVEAENNWVEEGKKLLDDQLLFVIHVAYRDPEPGDNLEEMLESQYAKFIEFADELFDDVIDAGIDLYCKTLEATLNFPEVLP